MAKTDKNIPEHVGLILDGNRRWAKKKGLPVFEGHAKGYEVLKDIIKYGYEKGVKTISVYVFSTENWKRSPSEVKYLMNLAGQIVKDDLAELDEKGVRLIWFGRRTRLEPKLVKDILKAEEKTKDNKKGNLVFCFNYGGQAEIVDAVKKLISQNQTINENNIEANLYGSQEVGPVDLLIRTSGEKRLSNFMVWRTAYSEFSFVDKLWPDFTTTDFDNCLADYANRKRRFGS